MKKPIVIGVLFGALITLTSEAAAQGPGEMIAYHACQFDWYLNGGYGSDLLICDVFLIENRTPSPTGSTTVHVGDGVGPVWSRDGMRLAVMGSREPGIFVLNLSDWSRVKVYGGGESPAWSPDGMKLAIAAIELYLIAADGSTSTQVTNNVGFVGQPAWSPDGGTIAFDCEVESGNRDICSIQADSTGFVRLTSDPESDSGAAFSPDGLTITFTSGSLGIAFMNPDGTEIRPAGDAPYAWVGIPGTQSAWSPDGTLYVYSVPFSGGGCPADGRICPDHIIITNPAGTEHTEIGGGNRPAWALAAHPVARFVAQPCNGLTCTFDGSASWKGSGSASYTWNFGDGTSDTGPTPTHVYAAIGTYSVTLTVTDDFGVVGSQTQVVEMVANVWPAASFTTACTALTCTFNGSGSSDVDGTIASYAWNFGDGTTGSGASVSHSYAAAGTYSVILTVTDNGGASAAQSQSVTVVPPEMHVGDLDRAITTQSSTWTATVTIAVHDSSHRGLSNATAFGSWNDGSTSSCTTNANGQCVVSKSGIPKKIPSVSFSVTNVARAPFVYTAAANRDADFDSDGTTISITKQ